jgi:hypothetical protein
MWLQHNWPVFLQVLREDVEAALAEASLAQERAALLGMEQDELQQQRDQLAGAPAFKASTPQQQIAGWLRFAVKVTAACRTGLAEAPACRMTATRSEAHQWG